MDILFRILITVILFGFFLYLLRVLGKNPDPLPLSDNPRKLLIEIIILTLFIYVYLGLEIFVLNPIFGFSYITIGLSTIIYLFFPLIYIRIKDQWTLKDFGINSKIKSLGVGITGIAFYMCIGMLNIYESTWDRLLILFYSNAFLEEFLFRGVIQSKLERALGQNKTMILLQALIFMLAHTATNVFQFLVVNDTILLFSKFLFQLLMGITFGLIYLKTRNLWVSVICHYLGNWLGSIIYLFR